MTHKNPKNQITDLPTLHKMGRRQAPDLFVAQLRKEYPLVPNASVDLLMDWHKQDAKKEEKK